MNETELRALFADAVAKGAMSADALDNLVADKIAKGECKSDDDKDGDDDKDSKFDADMIDKAATGLAEATAALTKAETTKANPGWEDPGAPDTGATNPETRPPTERTPLPLSTNWEDLNASSVMQDIVKAATAETTKSVVKAVHDLLKGALGDIESYVGEAIEKATKPQTDRIKALVSAAKAQNDMLKGVGDSVKKAATRKQVSELAKAGAQAPQARQGLPFERPNLANLQVVPAPGDRPPTDGRGGGMWTHDSLQDRIDQELNGFAKAAVNADSRGRKNVLAQASIELSSPGSNPDAIAAKHNIHKVA